MTALAAVWREIGKMEETLGDWEEGASQKTNAMGQVREDESSMKGGEVELSGTRREYGCKKWFRIKITRMEQLTTCGKWGRGWTRK